MTKSSNIPGIFEVVKMQLHTGLEGYNSPVAFGTYKKGGGPALGVVGKDFTPTQPAFLIDSFATSLEAHQLPTNKIQFKEVKGGARVIISSMVKEITIKNLAKKNDVIDMSIALQTGYDGRTVTSMFVDTNRLICTNGMTATNTDFKISFKNVKGNVGKANLMSEDIIKTIKNIEDLKATYTKLAMKKISKQDHEDFILKVTGMKMSDYANLSSRRQKMLDAINQSVAIEMKDAGASAWALLNGITRFTNHVANFDSKNDFLYADSGFFMNDRAQKAAYSFINN
ncbi:MAG: DUF932 domain-containing protein [Gloeobacteraceae cyanobacterium ES-bin-316]|nr:DUF932 domain-containing protein [Ferruginibacter sp.]